MNPKHQVSPKQGIVLEAAYEISRDLTADRFRLPASHPILSRIAIDPAEWLRLQQFDDDNPATKIVAHDEPLNGLMNVYVACASKEVRDRLEDGWD